MDEDILTLMEALTTQASDIDPDPVAAASVGVAPPIQTLPLEDALSTACHGVKLEQKTAHQKKTEETREIISFSPCLSAGVPGPCTNVTPEVLPDTNGGGSGEEKIYGKRRNRKKSKKVYLSSPVTLETQASSPSTFPCHASGMGAFSSKEQGRKGQEEKAVVCAQFWQEPAGTLLPETSPVQPSLEAISVADRKERKAKKRLHCKKKAKKNQKIESSPWPVTVQAWASFVSPDLGQTKFQDSLPAANDGIKGNVSALILSKGTQADILGSPAPLWQASWEEEDPEGNTKRKMNKNKNKGWQGKQDNGLDHTWPLELQAWAPFQAAAAPVQMPSEDISLQWERWPPLESEKERNSFSPWSEGTEEGSFSVRAPFQISLKEAPAMKIGQSETEAKRSPDTRGEQPQGSEVLALELYQNWANEEKYQGNHDGDDWEHSVLDLPTQAACYCEDPFLEEGSKAPTLARSDAYTSISEAETGRQEAEEDKATFQTLWMGKWGGF